MSQERIERELERLLVGGQRAEIVANGRPLVLYRDVPTGGKRLRLPLTTDVIVPIPDGYPASMIDLAGLPLGSPFLPRVKGGQNSQGQLTVVGQQWQLASYHPHNGGGGPPWNQQRHGFDTYFDHLLTWLDRLT
jgi:hypothetical protein